MTLSSYMPNLPAALLAASRDSHGVNVKADVYYGGAFVASVPLVSGTINVDRTSDNCRSGTAIVGDPTFAPTFINSPLAPYGAELKIQYGFVFDGGATTWIPLGVFTLNEADQEDSTGDLPELVFFDRSKVIQRAGFRGPGSYAGQDVRTCLTSLVQQVFPATSQPSVIFDPALGSTTQKIPGGTVFQTGDNSRWQAIQTLCSWLGAEGRFGWDGNFYVMPVPTLIGVSSPVPVWTFDAKQGTDQDPNGVLVQARRGMTREGCYNFVYVQGATSTNAATPVGWAFDSDPRSPTYWGATYSAGDSSSVQPFGPSVLSLQNDQLLTTAACNAYAAAQLSNVLGLARSLSFTAVTMAGLEAGDIVKAVYKSGAYEYHILDSFSIPLGADAGAFTGTTRTQTYQLTAGT